MNEVQNQILLLELVYHYGVPYRNRMVTSTFPYVALVFTTTTDELLVENGMDREIECISSGTRLNNNIIAPDKKPLASLLGLHKNTPCTVDNVTSFKEKLSTQ
jgi:hypothetical protein